MHVIAAPSLDFRDLVGVEALRAALAPLMPEVPRFYATACGGLSEERDVWGSYDEAAVCYGFDAQCYLKIDVEDGRVEAIWYECRTSDSERRAALFAALRAVDVLVPATLVDHRLKLEGAVADEQFLQSYWERLALQA